MGFSFIVRGHECEEEPGLKLMKIRCYHPCLACQAGYSHRGKFKCHSQLLVIDPIHLCAACTFTNNHNHHCYTLQSPEGILWLPQKWFMIIWLGFNSNLIWLNGIFMILFVVLSLDVHHNVTCGMLMSLSVILKRQFFSPLSPKCLLMWRMFNLGKLKVQSTVLTCHF